MREGDAVTLDVPTPRGLTFGELDALTLLACLVAGEARGEPFEGKCAVAWVVRNRVAYPVRRRFGGSWREVILKPRQFSCFNAEDPNRRKLARPLETFGSVIWGECYRAAAGVYFGFVGDPTDGADHYFATSLNPAPAWAAGGTELGTIGHHRFFRLVV